MLTSGKQTSMQVHIDLDPEWESVVPAIAINMFKTDMDKTIVVKQTKIEHNNLYNETIQNTRYVDYRVKKWDYKIDEYGIHLDIYLIRMN